LAHVWPNPHRADSVMVSPKSLMVSISSSRPSPLVIRVRISKSCVVPKRQGAHFPHDSDWVKLKKNRAISTMQLFSSITTIPPEPMMAPILCNVS